MRCHAPHAPLYLATRLLRVWVILFAAVFVTWQGLRDVPAFQRSQLVTTVEHALILAEKPRLSRLPDKIRPDPPVPVADLVASPDPEAPPPTGRAATTTRAARPSASPVFLRPEPRAPPREGAPT